MVFVKKAAGDPPKWDRARFYTFENYRHPSVTTITDIKNKPFLGIWMVNQEREAFTRALLDVLSGPHAEDPEKILDAVIAATTGIKAADKSSRKAKDIGTAAHAWIQWHLRKRMGKILGPEPIIPEESQRACVSFLDWEKEVRLVPLAVEATVYSKKYGYAGTLDFYGHVRDLPTVIDWKVSKAIYPEHIMQTIAYGKAAKEMGWECRRAMVLRLPKTPEDPDFEPMVIEESKYFMHFEGFLAAKKLWEWDRLTQGLTIGGPI